MRPPDTTRPPAAGPATGSGRGRGFRADVQGLRGVAVLAVVLFHAGVRAVGGGFAGVDVFFVLSGFLITGLLMRDVAVTGRVRFGDFYARRARRLLPAAALVLLVTAAVAVRVMPPLRVHSMLLDVRAAALYVGNYRFAAQGTDYLNADAPPSPVQHYWSLGVEEQFYLIWPALLLLAVLAARRWRLRRGVVVAATLAAVGVASFAASVWLTHADQPWAFFSLPTRAWELAAGGLVALAARRLARLPAAAGVALQLGGLVAVVATMLLLDAATPFPGTVAAVPVLGTAALLAGGCATGGGPVNRMLGSGPLQLGGRISYSWYLWHWPVLVLAPDVVGHPLGRPALLALAAGSGVLAYATTRLVEEPVRFSPALTGPARRSLTVGAALSVTVLAGSLALPVPATAPTGTAQHTPQLSAAAGAATGRQAPSAQRATAPAPPPTLAQRLTDAEEAVVARSVGIHWVPKNIDPALSQAHSDIPQPFLDGCHDSFTGTGVGHCVYEHPNSPTSVVLFGDSHATQWFPALDEAARVHDWKLTSLTKTTCPPFELSIFSPVLHRQFTECDQWRSAVLARIRAERPALVVLGAARHYGPEYHFAVYGPEWMSGMTKTIKEIEAVGSKVLVLGPSPLPLTDAADCLSTRLTDAVMCTRLFTAALNVPGAVAEGKVARAAGASYVDVAPWICTPQRCAVIVGNYLVYRDDNHVATPFSRWLAPVMAADVQQALRGNLTPA